MSDESPNSLRKMMRRAAVQVPEVPSIRTHTANGFAPTPTNKRSPLRRGKEAGKVSGGALETGLEDLQGGETTERNAPRLDERSHLVQRNGEDDPARPKKPAEPLDRPVLDFGGVPNLLIKIDLKLERLEVERESDVLKLAEELVNWARARRVVPQTADS